MRHRRYTHVLLSLLLLALCAAALAYDNDGRDAQGNGLLRGGPHRTINELAFDLYLAKMAPERLREGCFSSETLLTGPTVVAPGMELINTGDRSHPARWWVIEGGYDADEPELYNSFRHFYDPKALAGVPYLTDHLEMLEWVYRVALFTSVKGLATGAAAGFTLNPKVNARDWALTGEKNNGWGPNDYCLAKGQEYLRQAFQEADDKVKRDRLFAQAWRSLGETMHLLADMSCVPHVRNDSHPGKALYITGNTDPNRGILRNDPYELLCTEEMIRASKDFPVHPLITGLIDKAADPAGVFEVVSTYTNETFFSADTVAGTYIRRDPAGEFEDREITLEPANGQQPYPKPELGKLEAFGLSGRFYRQLNSRRILMCHESWSSSVGWRQGGMLMTRDAVRDQASLLVPLAVYANASLAKRFIPDIDTRVESCDLATGECAVRCVHAPSGCWAQPLEYRFGDVERVVVWVNGVRQQEELRHGVPEGTRLLLDLRRYGLKAGDRLRVGVEIGGILYPGKEEFPVGPAAAGPGTRAPAVSWRLLDNLGRELATGTGPTFQQTQTVPLKYYRDNAARSAAVATTVQAGVEAPVVKPGEPFTVTVRLKRGLACTPPDPALRSTGALGLRWLNFTLGAVKSLADAANPADIALKMEFRPIGNNRYQIDQTAVPGFAGYVTATRLPHGALGGAPENWSLDFAPGARDTADGHIRLRGKIDPLAETFTLSTAQWDSLALLLECSIVYQAR